MLKILARMETQGTLGLTDTAYFHQVNPMDKKCDWRVTGAMSHLLLEYPPLIAGPIVACLCKYRMVGSCEG